jgi:HTH-type transcriptional regulator/antitoxin MqsA
LTGEEVRALRVQLDLTQAEAARVFGGGQVAFSKYENDDVVQSEAMDKLLRVAAEVPGALRYLRMRAADTEEGLWSQPQWVADAAVEQPAARRLPHLHWLPAAGSGRHGHPLGRSAATERG